jgi:uncharacterized protein YbbC (DUF1343 family)
MKKAQLIPALILLFAQAVLAADEIRVPRVLNGIDVLREQNFAPLAGMRIGLITNHTGLSADGTTTIELLFKSRICRLAALFSPEHGVEGGMEGKVGNSVDLSTGLPVYSLYGETVRPTAEMLRGIDALVFDIQDIGARFYTYITTMAYGMEAAAEAGVPFYVLDRPNPVGGTRVEGPILDPDKTSFVGYMPLPVRHGMTVGELARYFNTENRIDARLQVIPMKGWHRSYYFWDTGQLWVNPSPNMRHIAAAIFYPGICMLEGTNVSVGRGTGRPFETVGAPWIDPLRFAAALQAERIAGVEFVPVSFTPDAAKHQGVQCGGVSLLSTDPERLNSVLLGLTVISVLRRLYPEEFDIDGVLRLLGNADALKLLKAGRRPAEVLRQGEAELQKFLEKRKTALIYD